MRFDINLDKSYHPQLVFNQGWGSSIQGTKKFWDHDHWSLTFINNQGDLDSEQTYNLCIRYYHGGDEGPHHFCFTQRKMGDHVELLTKEEWDDRVKAIIEHEGQEEADKWIDDNFDGAWPRVRIMSQWEQALLDKLKQRWLAVCELISPHVTL